MTKYRRKIEIVYAVPWTGNNKDEILSFYEDGAHFYNNCLFVDGALCNRGDYILKAEDNNIRIVKGDVFNELYEEID